MYAPGERACASPGASEIRYKKGMDRMLKSKCFVDPLEAPFSRRGSDLGFANANKGGTQFAKNSLYIMSCRGNIGSMGSVGNQNACRQVALDLMEGGRRLPTVIHTTEAEVILESLKGSVRFCIGERRLILGKSSDGLSLRFMPQRGAFGAGALELEPGSWRMPFGDYTCLLAAIRGSITGLPGGALLLTPDASGAFEFAFEEFSFDPDPRPIGAYPAYEDAVKAVQKDFDDFCADVYPSLPAEFEPMRRQALWTTWSLMEDPGCDGAYQHTMVNMMRILFEAAFGWQQAMQAIFLSRDARLAWNLLRSSFDEQDENGRIRDSISFRLTPGSGMKPPFQGVALDWLMDHCDLSCISREEKLDLYEHMKKWLEFFFRFRDLDHDGVWENQGPVETGWEDASYFYVGFPLACPDMNAYTVRIMDALARLGREIGVPEAECAALTKRADEATEKIIREFWTGERWVAKNPRTGKTADSLSLPMFGALILGKRLPAEILEKTVDYIWKNGFVTDHGFASESVDSPYFHHGFTGGSIIVPAQLIFCLALEAAGREDLAREMGLRYARALRDNGMYHILNAFTGEAERGLVAFGESQLFWSSWASSCYLFFAERYGK